MSARRLAAAMLAFSVAGSACSLPPLDLARERPLALRTTIRAADGTMTFLVKSRAVTPWSLSYDPDTGISHRHVPVEDRLEDLTNQL